MPTDDIAVALGAIRSGHYGTGPCAKCEKTALALIARELNCPNPWHASAPARMHEKCAECPSDVCATCEGSGCLGTCHDGGQVSCEC